MVVELSVLLALVSTVSAFVFGIKSINRAKKSETTAEASCMTKVIVKLDNIEKTVSNIRGDMTRMAEESVTIRERLSKVEGSLERVEKGAR